MNCNRLITDKDCNIIVQNDPFEEGFVYVYILQYNPSNEDNVINQMVIRESEEDEVLFSIGKDGFYTLLTIPMPTSDEEQFHFKDGYFYNGEDRVDVYDIVNTETTNLDICYEYYFSTCWLRKCYIKYAMEVLNNTKGLCSVDSKSNSDSIYKRDLLLSALTIIRYMAEFDQYEDAQKLIEKLESCNGLCSRSSDSDCGCGCGK